MTNVKYITIGAVASILAFGVLAITGIAGTAFAQSTEEGGAAELPPLRPAAVLRLHPLADALDQPKHRLAFLASEAVAKDALTKKVHDSYMSYMDKYTKWSSYSEAVYHGKILKS